jgi:UDP-N-acetylglucosamine--N-acetylmuramyl-(pentapeptide) pyrophosphoryl-undecaprenol N-acetylglucosamine transferase
METKKSVKTVCFVAGKSGGHLIPALTAAHRLRNEQQEEQIILFSTTSALDSDIIKQHASWLLHYPLPLQKVPSRWWGYPFFFIQFLYTFLKAFFILYRSNPARLISMGGLISIPACFAARILRIPIELYELNAVPGKAVTFLAPWAHTIYICFEHAKQYLPAEKCRITPYPIRFTHQDLNATLAPDKISFEIQRKTIFILGGSQGSVSLNALVKQWIETYPEMHTSIQIIHQIGSHDSTNWSAFYQKYGIPALVFTYYAALEECYNAASVIICRAGAGTLFEATFFKKQCITIPLETAYTDHQKDNAYTMAQLHPSLCTVLLQDTITKDISVLHDAIINALQQTPSVSHTQTMDTSRSCSC